MMRIPQTPPMLSRLYLVVSTTLILFIAGCATEQVMTGKFHLADGQTLEMDFVNGVPPAAKNDEIEINSAGFFANPATKNLIFAFKFREKKEREVKSVKVEDVTDPQSKLLVEDNKPELDAAHDWKGVSKFVTVDDPYVKWIMYIDNTVRVFKFTIVTKDDRQFVMYQAASFPPFYKEMVRRSLGMKS